MTAPLVWSTTPAQNGTIDQRTQWPPGMFANAVDTAGRGLMASAALARDDATGTLVATVNGSNVFTVTTNQGLIDPASTAGGGTARISHPFSLRVVLPAMNTAVATTAPTIVIDGAAAVPLTRRDGTALADGDLTGVPYEILGDTITAGAYGRARVLNLVPSDIVALQASGFPIGGILPFTGSNTPTGFLVASGSLLSRTNYAKLWAHAQASGTITDDGNWQGNIVNQGYYSTGDGSTSFRIPAINGLFLRATDLGRGIDPGRYNGSIQADAFRSHTHSLTQGGVVISGYAGTGSAYVATGSYLNIDSIAAAGGPETRPYNVAYPFLIRAY